MHLGCRGTNPKISVSNFAQEKLQNMCASVFGLMSKSWKIEVVMVSFYI